MRLLVMSDTHIRGERKGLPRAIIEEAWKADAVLHLGDFTELAAVKEIESTRPLYAVHGNNDAPEVRARYPALLRLELGGKRLALVHGHLGGGTALAAARAVTGADIVLFGHSHRGYLSREGGRMLLNPGSPTAPRFSSGKLYAILTIEDDVQDIQAEIIAVGSG